MSDRRESGIALLATLLLLSTVGVLAGLAVLISRFTGDELGTTLQRGRDYYTLESALNRTLAYLKADLAVNSNRDLEAMRGKSDITGKTRWVADNIPRNVLLESGVSVEVTIADAIAGESLADDDPSKNFTVLLEKKMKDWDFSYKIQYDRMLSVLQDYVDADDNAQLYGIEKNAYEAEKIAALPRNGQLEYMEELLWIPHFTEYFPLDENGVFPWFLPLSVKAPEGVTKKNLFSTPLAYIFALNDVDYFDEDKIAEGLASWRTDRDTPLQDLLPFKLYTLLTNQFSLTESGIYTVRISLQIPDQPPMYLFVIFNGATPLNFLECYVY